MLCDAVLDAVLETVLDAVIDSVIDAVLDFVIVTTPQYVAFEGDADNEALDGFHVAHTSGGYMGIEVVVPASVGIAVQQGDMLDLEGDHQEFHCQSQFMATNYATKGSTIPPGATTVDCFDLALPAIAEQPTAR